MATLKIITYPNEILTKRSVEIKKVGEEEKRLFNDLKLLMYEKKGIGIAAVQVGILKRMFVVDICNEKNRNVIFLANPVILTRKGEVCGEEGCLSVPGETIKVNRASQVVVRGLNYDGHEITVLLTGLEAIAVQHELDHLDGKVILDYKEK